jgi:hypothetical protein
MAGPDDTRSALERAKWVMRLKSFPRAPANPPDASPGVDRPEGRPETVSGSGSPGPDAAMPDAPVIPVPSLDAIAAQPERLQGLSRRALRALRIQAIRVALACEVAELNAEDRRRGHRPRMRPWL